MGGRADGRTMQEFSEVCSARLHAHQPYRQYVERSGPGASICAQDQNTTATDERGYRHPSHITKRFGGTTALRDVSLHLEAGEVLAFPGENGAGKSTLTKSLAGIHTPDEGRILFKSEGHFHKPPKPNEKQKKWPSSIRTWVLLNG